MLIIITIVIIFAFLITNTMNKVQDANQTGTPKKCKSAKKQDKLIYEPIKTVSGETIIKKYVKIKLVGSGAYSNCYLVKNVESQSTYVVKILPKAKLQTLISQKLFYEIKIHKSLVHPYIVYFDHWFEDEKYQYIFLEYCPNGNLEDLVSKLGGNIPEKLIKKYIRQITEVIGYIHSQKVLHRDLKLSNFYLDENDDIKLGDFGFACQLSNDHDRKRETCGTPNYIAPEVISGFGYTFSSDVWAIGVMLYRMKFGQCPFEGQTVKNTLQNVKTCNYTISKSKKTSSEFKDLIARIFNLNYDDRLTPEQILAHQFLNDCPIIAQSPENKRKFSFTKLFSMGKNEEVKHRTGDKNGGKKVETRKLSERKGVMKRDFQNAAQNQLNKRSNSCETLKEIKEILKGKSKPTLVTNSNLCTNANSRAQIYSSRSFNAANSMRENSNSSVQCGTNGSSFLENSLNMSINSLIAGKQAGSIFESEGVPKETRKSKLNDFINTQINNISLKQQIRQGITNNFQTVQGVRSYRPDKPNLKIANNSLAIQHHQKELARLNSLLSNAQKRFYLPKEVHKQRDIYVIDYHQDLKQIIHGTATYLLYEHGNIVYSLSGEIIYVDQLPKVIRHVISSKVALQSARNLQGSQQKVQRLRFLDISARLPHFWKIADEGIVLKYGYDGCFCIGKAQSQSSFYAFEQQQTKSVLGNEQKKSKKRDTFMFTHVKGQFRISEGIPDKSYYDMWIRINLKKQQSND